MTVHYDNTYNYFTFDYLSNNDIFITLKLVNITYNDITYNAIAYNDITYD
jgi:hypothetical protein